MKKRQTFEIQELVQEIDMLIDDWYFTKCPNDEARPKYKHCDECPHFKLCKCLLKLSTIKVEMYDSNGELKK